MRAARRFSRKIFVFVLWAMTGPRPRLGLDRQARRGAADGRRAGAAAACRFVTVAAACLEWSRVSERRRDLEGTSLVRRARAFVGSAPPPCARAMAPSRAAGCRVRGPRARGRPRRHESTDARPAAGVLLRGGHHFQRLGAGHRRAQLAASRPDDRSRFVARDATSGAGCAHRERLAVARAAKTLPTTAWKASGDESAAAAWSSCACRGSRRSG